MRSGLRLRGRRVNLNVQETQLKLPPGVLTKRKKEKYLFLNPQIPDWIIVNSNGAAALKLCNGERTIGDIGRIVSRVAQRDAREEIANFFQEVISTTNFFSASVNQFNPAHPYKLNCIHLNLTNRCNLQCVYCYAEERNDSKTELCLSDYVTIVDSINNLTKNAEIVFTGGEPLLVNYMFDVATYAKSKGNQIHLLTNGTLIDSKTAEILSELFDLIKVSIDGADPKIHDWHRGNGAFARTMKSIDLLIKKNAKLKISMTVTKKNINNIPAMVNRFGSLLSFAPLFKAGRAKKNKQLAVTGREYYKALSSITGVNPMSYLASSLQKAKEQRILKCSIGDAEISISDTGDVYPCHLLHLPQFLAGNIRQQSLESIYQTSDKLKACKGLNVTEIKGCTRCAVRFICGGACRARAFYEKGRIDVSDAFCKYEKLAFTNGLFEAYELDGSKLDTISYGKERPVCTEHNEGCWAQNRRDAFVPIK